ncbi:DUF6573 family protein [Thiomonas delicata]|uniref:Uncharacterized protein n=1 Tax=Thiomonas delicata TaxID=364030 RepID=A0A238D7I5_THIDL|nr:DUF6573 family protein [Thiomonas delicata]SBP89267.1 conserved hypothetical protein [Thiomonas delicata]
MNTNTTTDTLTEFFGEPIHTYTRAQAIEDGMLIDVSTTAREAGIVWPVAVTSAAWGDAIAWSDADDRRKKGRASWQSESGRLWDVVWMASHAIRAGLRHGDDCSRNILFRVLRIPRDGRGARPTLTTLSLHVGPGDDRRPVITIMLPGES